MKIMHVIYFEAEKKCIDLRIQLRRFLYVSCAVDILTSELCALA